MPVLKSCTPRPEVLHGDLEDAIFAADFGDLVAGKAPKVYATAETFFQNTHPAKELTRVVQLVFERLAKPKEGGAVVRLSTGYGGGKSHTLMTLWHLARNLGDATLGTEILPAAGRPSEVSVVAIDAAKAGVPVFAEHGKAKTHSLWGEIFFLLGGEKALRELGKADAPEGSPSESQLEGVFPKGPVLVLLDELVIYMAKLSEQGQGNFLGFLGSLISVASKRPQTVLVVTDPADQRSYSKESSLLGDKLREAAIRLDQVLGRKMSDFDPIGNEAPKVIARRLFERIDPHAAQKASALFHDLFSRVLADHPGALPETAASAEYAKRIVDTYPFHPRLLDTAQHRLAALPDFQRSRGVLRLFARLVRDVWEAKVDCELVSAGEIDWKSPRIQGDLLQRLNRDQFRAVVGADLEGHATELDGGKHGLHTRTAAALLLESLAGDSNAGLTEPELSLAILRPADAGDEPAEALGRLTAVCWHTYPMPSGRGWQFRVEPNVIKQIEERLSGVSREDAHDRVRTEVQGYFSGPAVKVVNWPTSPRQVPEAADLQLALCDSEEIARRVCDYSDDTDAGAKLPRRFRNAILAVTASPAALQEAITRARRLLAAEEIEKDAKTGEGAKLVREQLARIVPQVKRAFSLQARRAFDRVQLPGRPAAPIEEQYQVPEDQILQKAMGQATVRRFLDDKGLIFQPNDALDPHRLLQDVLPGTTPTAEAADAYSAKSLHERLLSAPNLRLVPDKAFVIRSVLRAVKAGSLVALTADGRAWDANGCVEGPVGARKRRAGDLTSVSLDDKVLITTPGTETAKRWLSEAPSEVPGGGAGGRTGPGPGGVSENLPVTVGSFPEAGRLAARRPLLFLALSARTPADASQLAGLCQPFGANKIHLEVRSGGQGKDGETLQFQGKGLKLNHPAKPLDIAATLFNAVAEAARSYEVKLVLHFDESGRSGLADTFKKLAESAPEGVGLSASFGPEPGGAA